jgi:hypothetical protein
MKPIDLKFNGKYNFINQSERLIYLGCNRSGNGYWHQFAKVEDPEVVWAEMLDSDLANIEETVAEPAAEKCDVGRGPITSVTHTIWKFLLPYKYGGDISIRMPKGADVFTIAEQNNHLYMWALVDVNAIPEIRHFCVVGTGQSVEVESKAYLGTALLHNETLVLHVFEQFTIN